MFVGIAGTGKHFTDHYPSQNGSWNIDDNHLRVEPLNATLRRELTENLSSPHIS
jgi:hypothetical protein